MPRTYAIRDGGIAGSEPAAEVEEAEEAEAVRPVPVPLGGEAGTEVDADVEDISRRAGFDTRFERDGDRVGSALCD